MNIPGYLEALIRELSRLPGIGPKSASRLAFHILKMNIDDVRRLSGAIIDTKTHVTTCPVCGGIAEGGDCAICVDPARERGVLCVVENAKDVLTIEKTGEYRGLYHVLTGVISPLDGIGPEDLNIKPLVQRCAGGAVKEIIIATNPTIEGDATETARRAGNAHRARPAGRIGPRIRGQRYHCEVDNGKGGAVDTPVFAGSGYEPFFFPSIARFSGIPSMSRRFCKIFSIARTISFRNSSALLTKSLNCGGRVSVCVA